jgi:putative nucleotidyltransferase with HDIG domain
MRSAIFERVAEINKELWLLLSVFVITAVLNFTVASHHLVLGFYVIPTLFSAYFFGRRHALLTAFASVLLVLLLIQINPATMKEPVAGILQKWLDLTVWGGTLVVTAYAMGTLYEHRARNLAELRETYNGVLLILCHFISKDNYTQNHSYRVSVYATRIAECMRLSPEVIEDVRAAALLHDIGKLEVSRKLLYKTAKLTEEEYKEISQHVGRGASLVHSVGGSLRRVVPLILAHHDRFDGTGPNGFADENIPLGARIISVADVYDAMTSDRPYRKAVTPLEAQDYVVRTSGEQFDPKVVVAFTEACRQGLMEVPELMV